jgi:hypothetical protein
VNRRIGVFFALVGAPPIALASAAAILMTSAMSGRHIVWQATDANLVAAIEHHSPVAMKVFVETLPSVDTPVPFSHSRLLNSKQVELPPLVIALLHGDRHLVELLRRTGSDPAKALGQVPRETASALLAWAVEMQNHLAIEYLTTYRPTERAPEQLRPRQ